MLDNKDLYEIIAEQRKEIEELKEERNYYYDIVRETYRDLRDSLNY